MWSPFATGCRNISRREKGLRDSVLRQAERTMPHLWKEALRGWACCCRSPHSKLSSLPNKEVLWLRKWEETKAPCLLTNTRLNHPCQINWAQPYHKIGKYRIHPYKGKSSKPFNKDSPNPSLTQFRTLYHKELFHKIKPRRSTRQDLFHLSNNKVSQTQQPFNCSHSKTKLIFRATLHKSTWSKSSKSTRTVRATKALQKTSKIKSLLLTERACLSLSRNFNKIMKKKRVRRKLRFMFLSSYNSYKTVKWQRMKNKANR